MAIIGAMSVPYCIGEAHNLDAVAALLKPQTLFRGILRHSSNPFNSREKASSHLLVPFQAWRFRLRFSTGNLHRDQGPSRADAVTL